MTGQAAGTAAALAAQDGRPLDHLDVDEIQEQLEQTGVRIHF
jgi:hypothetical protein